MPRVYLHPAKPFTQISEKAEPLHPCHQLGTDYNRLTFEHVSNRRRRSLYLAPFFLKSGVQPAAGCQFLYTHHGATTGSAALAPLTRSPADESNQSISGTNPIKAGMIISNSARISVFRLIGIFLALILFRSNSGRSCIQGGIIQPPTITRQTHIRCWS